MNDYLIVIDDGRVFEGTVEQFQDCFFDNATPGTISEWCLQKGWEVTFRPKEETSHDKSCDYRMPEVTNHHRNSYPLPRQPQPALTSSISDTAELSLSSPPVRGSWKAHQD